MAHALADKRARSGFASQPKDIGIRFTKTRYHDFTMVHFDEVSSTFNVEEEQST